MAPVQGCHAQIELMLLVQALRVASSECARRRAAWRDTMCGPTWRAFCQGGNGGVTQTSLELVKTNWFWVL